MTTGTFLSDSWKQFREHKGLHRYLSNTGWMFGARVITFLTSFFTIAIVARYLGPANLGKLDYAQSFVAIISVFASLGIDQILYRDLVLHPEKENDLLGTAIFSKLAFGILAFIVSVVLSLFIDNESVITLLIGISAFTFIVSPIGTVSILFNAQVKSKYASQVLIFIGLFIPLLKILTVYLHKGIIYFALLLVVESLISAGWSVYIYVVKFHHNPRAWHFRPDIFKQLMRDSWPLLLAGFSGYIYAKIDQVLLLHYIDSTAVGIYGAAVKLTQIWAFFPGLIISSLFPAIVNAKKVGFELYSKRLRALGGLTVGVTIAIALPLFIFAPFVIHLVFGSAYMASVPILRIYLWTSVAITVLVLCQHYLIAENLSRIFLYTSIIGATVNVILNIILIPAFGLAGSAWGTMLSYSMVAISLLFFKNSREGLLKVFSLLKSSSQ